MYRAALRPAARALSRHASSPASRRLASTSPVDRPRSWKSSVLRWGLAGGALYYYSTSSVFAEEPSHLTSPPPSHFSDNDLPTVDSVIEEKRKQIQERLESKNVVREATATQSPAGEKTKQSPTAEATSTDQQPAAAADGSAAALEEEAGQQGAFNPETGEINWDCPCLGGMAHGPCGEEFKTAFSCFVYSDAEPKGMDCIDKFQGMQDCFRQHPDVYGAELAEDEAAEQAAEEHAEQQAGSHAASVADNLETAAEEPDRQQLRETTSATPRNKAEKDSESLSKPLPNNDPFPTKWDDATAANDAVPMKNPKEKQDQDEGKKDA